MRLAGRWTIALGIRAAVNCASILAAACASLADAEPVLPKWTRGGRRYVGMPPGGAGCSRLSRSRSVSALGIDTNTPSLPIKTASGEGSCMLVWVAGCRLGAVGWLALAWRAATAHCCSVRRGCATVGRATTGGGCLTPTCFVWANNCAIMSLVPGAGVGLS